MKKTVWSGKEYSIVEEVKDGNVVYRVWSIFDLTESTTKVFDNIAEAIDYAFDGEYERRHVHSTMVAISNLNRIRRYLKGSEELELINVIRALQESTQKEF